MQHAWDADDILVMAMKQAPRRYWSAWIISEPDFSNTKFNVFFSYDEWRISQALTKWNMKVPKAK